MKWTISTCHYTGNNVALPKYLQRSWVYGSLYSYPTSNHHILCYMQIKIFYITRNQSTTRFVYFSSCFAIKFYSLTMNRMYGYWPALRAAEVDADEEQVGVDDAAVEVQELGDHQALVTVQRHAVWQDDHVVHLRKNKTVQGQCLAVRRSVSLITNSPNHHCQTKVTGRCIKFSFLNHFLGIFLFRNSFLQKQGQYRSQCVRRPMR